MDRPLPEVCQHITSEIERVGAGPLSEVAARLSTLKINGDSRRFLINRMGSTGSTWLAKLLNSHPDVYCSHEGFVARAYPSTECTGDDMLDFIEYFAWDTQHGAYQVLGDVGSIWAGHLAHLKSITTGILVRHPARLLNTRLTIYPDDQSFSAIPPATATCVRAIWGIELQDQAPIDRIFLHDIFTFASQVWALGKADLLIRIENMQDPEYCRKTLRALTGLDYGNELIEPALRKRVNHRTQGSPPVSRIVAGFSPQQRDWYELMLRDAVSCFGYSLMDEPEPLRFSDGEPKAASSGA